MTQPTHDEVIAWLKAELTYCDDILEFGADTLESNFKNMVSHYRASLLANRAVLERHNSTKTQYGKPMCDCCYAQNGDSSLRQPFPCPTYTDIYDPIVSVM